MWNQSAITWFLATLLLEQSIPNGSLQKQPKDD